MKNYEQGDIKTVLAISYVLMIVMIAVWGLI